MPLPSFLRIALPLLISAIAYIILGNFTNRSDFSQLFVLFSFTFASYIWLVRQPISFKIGLLATVAFRLLLFFDWPALSDDFFRFIWDGSLVVNGLNPYLTLPSQILPEVAHIPNLNTTLYHQLNSPHYFTVYPPVCQFIFGLSTWISSGNNWVAVVVMRSILFAAELGNIYLMVKLLNNYRKPVNLVFWYGLNPLVIVELTGNLHFEALMLFFTLLSLYLFTQHKTTQAGVALALAIGVKLLPLLFLPFLFLKLNLNKWFSFGAAISLTLLLLFLPFLSAELFYNIGQSLDLYFQKFEFNASIYYVFRWLGYQAYGYNNIAHFGPLLSVITFLSIMALALISRQAPADKLPVFLMSALTIYFFLATTVHPWYLTTLAAFAVFTPFRFAFLWTWAAVLSYATYQTKAFQENLFLTTLEYGLVWGWLAFEIIKFSKNKTIKEEGIKI